MSNSAPFKFRRGRGIVWVCDLSKSSSYLNDNESVDDMETFIPRLYYISKLIVESFGGVFMKWTGDGFLAWFEIELDRHKVEKARKVYEAAWHLTFMTNITQLGLKPKKKFAIRHGITYEKDALLMTLTNEQNVESFDIIGRAVVLAFRLSGIQAGFPSIVTVKEIVDAKDVTFRKFYPNQEEKLKFFKGEKYGTETIYISEKKKQKPRSTKAVIKSAKDSIEKAEGKTPIDPNNPILILIRKMNAGPDWCKEVIRQEVKFLKDEMLIALKEVITVLEKRSK